MSTRLVNLVVDAADPHRLGAFWAELLDWQVAVSLPEEVDVRAPAPDGWDLDLSFVPVPEPKVAQNRIHVDLSSQSAQEQEQRVARACELGARQIDIGQRDVPWVVLADPEGNEFCVREPYDVFSDTGAVGAILVDAADPAALGAFWARAAGWEVTRTTANCVALRAPTGRGPWLEFWAVPQPKSGKNRLHLDVAPPVGGDHHAEAERLISLGAHPADIGQRDVPWVVLADPEGNEFCVLTPR